MRPTARERHLANIRRDVAILMARDLFESLEMVLDLTGFTNNFTTATSETLAAAIVALAGVIPLKDLRAVAEGAAFYLVRPFETPWPEAVAS